MNLPDELLTAVLECLDAPDLLAACQVNRRWASLERAAQASLWRRLVLAEWPISGAGGALEALKCGWRARYRLLYRKGRPAELDDEPPSLATQLARLGKSYSFVLELSSRSDFDDPSQQPVATLPVELSDALGDGIVITSCDRWADAFTLSTELLLHAALPGPPAARLPAGVLQASQDEGVPYGELTARVYVRRRSDGAVALFADSIHLSLEDAAVDPHLTHVPVLRRHDAVVAARWDHGTHALSSSPLPGDGEYAVLQRDVMWNASYQLGVGWEIECVEGRPVRPASSQGRPHTPLARPPHIKCTCACCARWSAPRPTACPRTAHLNPFCTLPFVRMQVRIWVGLFLLQGARSDETDPASWRLSDRADPEPIKVELLGRILRGSPAIPEDDGPGATSSGGVGGGGGGGGCGGGVGGGADDRGPQQPAAPPRPHLDWVLP